MLYHMKTFQIVFLEVNSLSNDNHYFGSCATATLQTISTKNLNMQADNK